MVLKAYLSDDKYGMTRIAIYKNGIFVNFSAYSVAEIVDLRLNRGI